MSEEIKNIEDNKDMNFKKETITNINNENNATETEVTADLKNQVSETETEVTAETTAAVSETEVNNEADIVETEVKAETTEIAEITAEAEVAGETTEIAEITAEAEVNNEVDTVETNAKANITLESTSSRLEQVEAANLLAEKAIKQEETDVKLQAENANKKVENASETSSADSAGKFDGELTNVDNNENQESDVALNNNEQLESREETVAQNDENELLTEEQKRIEDAKKDAKWYVLHTFSGFENVAKTNLEIVIQKNSLEYRIFDIIIPMEDVVEEKNGKRKVVPRKIMPGYIYVKMIYGDDIWHAVTRTRGITSFAGPKGRPLPLTEEETRRMHLEKVVVIDVDLAENDKVEVLDGPLNGFIGTVLSVDATGKKCRVIVEMFGRETPVDLSLEQVRKIN